MTTQHIRATVTYAHDYDVYMSEFAEHIKFGHFSHVAVTAIVVPVGLFTLPTALLAAVVAISLPLTLFCAILPDVDHPTSKAHNIIQYLLFISIVASMTVFLSGRMLTIGLAWSSLLTAVPTELILATVGFLAIATGGVSLRVFERIRPPHRGVTHNVGFGAAVCVIIAGATLILQPKLTSPAHTGKTAAILGTYAFCGFFSHILADGMTLFSRLNGGIVGQLYVRVRSLVRRLTN